MKYVTFLLFLIVINCNFDREESDTEKLKTIQASKYTVFFDVFIESDRKVDGMFSVKRFIKEMNGERFTLPNFSYYSKDKVFDSTLFDTKKFALANDIKGADESFKYVKKISDEIFNEYKKLNIPKIFSSSNQGEFIVFFITNENVIVYVTDKNSITNEFWKRKIDTAVRIEDNWYRIKY